MKRAIVVAIAACHARPIEPPVRPIAVVATIAVDAAPPVVDLAPRFEVPPPRDRIVGLGRGSRHACVVRASGHVDCWGQPDRDKPADPTVRRIPGIVDATAISVNAACVLRATGDVMCFRGDALELSTTPRFTNVAVLGTGGTSCAVARDGQVTCVEPGEVEGARILPGATDAIAVTDVRDIVCAVRTSGQVVCTHNVDEAPFAPIPNVALARQFVLSGGRYSHGCVLLATGMVRCFSIYDARKTGNVELAYADDFVPDPRHYDDVPSGPLSPTAFSGASWISVAPMDGGMMAGPLPVAAIVGGVVMWTRQGTRMSELPDLHDIAQLVVGCAVRVQGSVVCWGSNAGGALGQPATVTRSDAPLGVPGLIM